MTDNGSPADANAASEPAEEFPSKLRVHALARVLGQTSRQVLAHLTALGVQTRSPQSSVDREVAQAVAERVRAHVDVDEPEAATAAGATTDDRAGVGSDTGTGPDTGTRPVTDAPDTDTADTDTAGTGPADAGSAAAEPAAVEAGEVPAGEDQGAATERPASEDSDRGSEIDAGSGGNKDTGNEDSGNEVSGNEDRGNEGGGAEELSLFSAAADRYDRPMAADREAAEDAASGPLFLQPHAADPSAPTGPKPTPAGEADGAAKSDPAPNDPAPNDAASNADADNNNDNNNDGDSGRGRRRRRGRRGRGRGRGDQAGGDGSSGDDSASDQSRGETSSDLDGRSRTAAANRAGDEGGESAPDSDDSSGGPDSGPTDSEPTDSVPADDTGSDKAKTGGKPSGKKGKKSKAKKTGSAAEGDSNDAADGADQEGRSDSDDDGDAPSSKRRRRRRRRKGGSDADEGSPDDPPNTVVHEREPRSKRARDEVQGISGSTRLEAKRQRRRDGRDAGRRRPPILTESEFLARREAVDRVMVVRERSLAAGGVDGVSTRDGQSVAVEDYTQVAVLEDGVLVEHFVTTETSSSMVGNIYLGRVQNVLPGMEAAFVDIGRGRNGVLYAGEVNWDAAGLDGGSRKIEQALKPGDNVLVQVSKDPVGHKGARLTTQISLAGRYLVYVPSGSSTGISRKLPDVERKRLKQVLAKLVPDNAGVIIRTASEGVSAEELGADIARLEAKWKSIDDAVTAARSGSGSVAPKALYEEPDLLVRVVRDLFNEDFKQLVVEGDKAWNLVEGYVQSVAPDLMERVERFDKPHADAPDSFVVHRIDEQLAKALDRKVWLPSGGTLIIEHTEAMTVVDVNTGKFTGSGGNLEETVTRNNLEAAEEIVRQMRLRDIGGMIIVDFIDMVLESNRDLVLRRLTEALARDRTRHQVSEVTSLGLVQMTRKRLGTGLLEAFSTTCTTCAGRGIIVHASPVETKGDDGSRADGSGSKRSRRGKRKAEAPAEPKAAHNPAEHPMFRAMAAHAHDTKEPDEAPQTAATAPDQPEPASAQPEPASAQAEPASAPAESASAPAESAGTQPEPASGDSEVAPSDGQATGDGGATKRRRRVVRRAASPTKGSEPVVLTADLGGVADTSPRTTSGPTTTGGTDAAVAVRRRPRRRSAGRPAGPPPGDD